MFIQRASLCDVRMMDNARYNARPRVGMARGESSGIRVDYAIGIMSSMPRAKGNTGGARRADARSSYRRGHARRRLTLIYRG